MRIFVSHALSLLLLLLFLLLLSTAISQNTEFYDITIERQDLPKAAKVSNKVVQDESNATLNSFLDVMDTTHDKLIDKDELRSWIVGSLQYLTEEDVLKSFDILDADKSDRISWEEVKAEEFNGGEPKDRKYFYLFKAADKDSSGALSIQEYSSYLQPAGDLQLEHRLLNQILAERDTNEDNVLDFEEFLGAATDGPEKYQVYHQLDTNSDGSLSSPEILAWVVFGHYNDTATNEANHILTNFDKDKDGFISYQEAFEGGWLATSSLESEETYYDDEQLNMYLSKDEL